MSRQKNVVTTQSESEESLKFLVLAKSRLCRALGASKDGESETSCGRALEALEDLMVEVSELATKS
jgi:hypothetical protein